MSLLIEEPWQDRKYISSKFWAIANISFDLIVSDIKLEVCWEMALELFFYFSQSLLSNQSYTNFIF